MFIDCDRESWNMDPGLLEEELERCEKRGRLPKPVVPTDLYGQCCDLPRIVEICDRYGVPVICDSAEALGARFLAQRRKDAEKRRSEVIGQKSGKDRDQMSEIRLQKRGLFEMPNSELRFPVSGSTLVLVHVRRFFRLMGIRLLRLRVGGCCLRMIRG